MDSPKDTYRVRRKWGYGDLDCYDEWAGGVFDRPTTIDSLERLSSFPKRRFALFTSPAPSLRVFAPSWVAIGSDAWT